MFNRALALLFVSALLPALPAEDSSLTREKLTPTPAEKDARLGWWREARFGMFVHWGVYSYLAGTWQGKKDPGYAEHIQRTMQIPIPVYRQEVAGHFNPTQFDADAWIRTAKETGMGYFIITAKHHDGFAMYDSHVSDYNIVKATPYHHDPMKDLREAARKYGIKFGFYYSHAFDWGEANAPGNDWDYQNPGGDKLLHGSKWWLTYPDFLPKAHQYVSEKAIPQLQELIRRYDPDILWFDTPHKLPPEENLRILAAVRQEKPSLVVNGRLIAGCGDYLNTADRPAEIAPTAGDWEGIPTTNNSYGYNENQTDYKSPGYFIQLLAKSASRGGNVLMNIGPHGDGTIDSRDLAILHGISTWWQVNHESILGTSRTPLPVQAYGESTLKGNRLYLHVFNWPANHRLTVGGLKTPIQRAWLLAQPNLPLPVEANRIQLPPQAPDTVDSVVAVECPSPPQADPHRWLVTNQALDTLRTFDAMLVGNLGYGDGKEHKAWVTNWKNSRQAVVWPVHVEQPATYHLSLRYDAPDASHEEKIEGDAGREIAGKSRGAAGTYVVSIQGKTWTGTVRNGVDVTADLGEVSLQPGDAEIKVSAQTITGSELMRLTSVLLRPVKLSTEP